MSKLVKGILIGAVASAVVVGAWVPMGANKLTLIDRIKDKVSKDENEEA